MKFKMNEVDLETPLNAAHSQVAAFSTYLKKIAAFLDCEI
jgi:hypothetical protein